MKTKHTEGQWSYELSKPYNSLMVKSGTHYIAEINYIAFNDDRGDQTEANAKLIAAAPTLIQELRQVFDRLVSFREECLSEEDTQAMEIIIDIETSILEHLHNHGYTNNANATK